MAGLDGLRSEAKASRGFSSGLAASVPISFHPHVCSAGLRPAAADYRPFAAHDRSDGCLFCRPDDPTTNTVIAQTENCYVRLDNYPAAEGHVEIVPKRHVASYFDLTPGEILEIHSLLLHTKDLWDSRYGPDGYTIGVNEGEAAGRTVHHVHVHLVPRHWNDVKDPRGGIRRALPNGDPDAWGDARPAAPATKAG